MKKNSFYCYPIPVSDFLNIKLENNNSSAVKIYNLLGEIVYQSAINNHQSTIDIASQPTGTYFIALYSGNSMVAREKLLIIR